MTEQIGQLTDERIEEFMKVANRIATHLISTCGGFHDDDRDNILQELLLAIVQGIEHFDPNRASLGTFADRIMRNRSMSLIREQQAAKRHWRLRGPSLSQAPNESGGGNNGTKDQVDRIQLKLDLDEVMKLLPRRQRKYASLLMGGASHAEVRRNLGLSRREADGDRSELLRLFEDAGLRDYV